MLPALRVMFCGSVDDGKSTLIGRLLHDAELIPEDQRRSLIGPDGLPDYARLTDGLADERAAGITIDVAWRYASSPRRRLMIADSPGHEQYTRNMATAASQIDCAVVLLDVTRGVMAQTRRHAAILSMFGVRHLILAVNKMDLVQHTAEPFRAAAAAFRSLVSANPPSSLTAIPVVARDGEMVARRGTALDWFDGPTLLEHLETLDTTRPEDRSRPFRLPVQTVIRARGWPRLYAGTVTQGVIRPGDMLADGRQVARIVTMGGDLDEAVPGQAVAVALTNEHDIARGDVLAAEPAPTRAIRLEARLIWLSARPLLPGRGLLVRIGTRTVPATIVRVHTLLDIGAHETVASRAVVAGETIGLNAIADVTIALAEPCAMAQFDDEPSLGALIVIDRQTAETMAAGVITRAAPPSGDVVWQTATVDRAARAAALAQTPRVLWFTGLPGSGKSTIANLVDRRLHAAGLHTVMLDGDNLRHGLCRDLGFSEADRVENIRRTAEVARLMADAGLIVIVALISPYRADRDAARALFDPGAFLEVFVDTPVGECRKRDPKGLYARADAGTLTGLSGVDAPYEPPTEPELRLTTMASSAEDLADHVLEALARADRAM